MFKTVFIGVGLSCGIFQMMEDIFKEKLRLKWDF